MDRWTAEQRAPKEFGTALQAQTFQRVYPGRHGLKIRAIPTECGRIRSDRLIMRKARIVCQRVYLVVIRMLFSTAVRQVKHLPLSDGSDADFLKIGIQLVPGDLMVLRKTAFLYLPVLESQNRLARQRGGRAHRHYAVGCPRRNCFEALAGAGQVNRAGLSHITLQEQAAA